MQYIKNICFALLVLCCSILGFSTANAAGIADPVDRVTVTGVASMEAAPDTASVNIEVLGRGDTADAAAAEAARKMANIKRALLGLNITRDQIENTYYYLNPMYGDKMKVIGYSATNSVKIEINDINKLGEVIDKLTAAGADSVNNVSCSVSNRSLLQNQLLGQAVANARQQAAVVASAAGRNLGRLTNANIQSVNDYDLVSRNVMMKAADGAGEATRIEPKNIKIKVRVECSFAMS